MVCRLVLQTVPVLRIELLSLLSSVHQLWTEVSPRCFMQVGTSNCPSCKYRVVVIIELGGSTVDEAIATMLCVGCYIKQLLL